MPKAKNKKLTVKRKRFVDYYIITHGNATEAGHYSGDTPCVIRVRIIVSFSSAKDEYWTGLSKARCLVRTELNYAENHTAIPE